MDKETRDFIYFFFVPGVIVGLTFTVLIQIYPGKNIVWLGLLVSLTFSVAVKAWTEIRATRGNITALGNELTGHASIIDDYDELMLDATDLVLNPENRNASVYVYKGYPLSMEREGDYFQATVNAINQGKIANYNRIMSVRNADEVRSVIDVLRVLSKSENASSRITFYANFRAASNFISFIFVNDDQCLIALPNLTSKNKIIGHRCGLKVKDAKVVHSLREIFFSIADEETTEEIKIPPANTSEDQWLELRNVLIEKATQNCESGATA